MVVSPQPDGDATVLPPATSSSVTLASLVLVSAANLLLVVVGGRLLGPAALGEYIVLITVVQSAAMALSVGIDTSIVYFIGGDVGGRGPEVRRASLRIAIVLGVLGALAVVATIGFGFVEGGAVGMLGVAAVPLQLGARRHEGLLRAHQRIGTLAVARVVQALVVGVSVLAAVMMQAVTLVLLVAIWVAAWAANLAVMSVVLPAIEDHPSASGSLESEMVRFGLRGHVGLLAQYANYRADLLLVAGFAGSAAAGVYGIVGRAIDLLWYVPTAVNVDLFPRIVGAEALESGATSRRADRAATVVGAITLTGAVIGVLLAPVVVETFFGAEFTEAANWIRIVLPGAVALSVGKVYGQELIARDKPEINTGISVVALVVAVVLGILLIPRFGAVAAAWISTSLYALQAVATLIAVRQARHVN
jgi:O-antigen/teichoic acid export membrane protein